MKVPWGAGAETSLYTATPYNLEFSLEISTQIMPHPWLRHRNAFQGKPVLNKSGGEVWLCCFIGVLVLFWNCVCTHVCMIVGVYVHAHTHMYAPWHTWNSWLSSSKKLQDRLWSEGLHFLPVLQSFSLSFFPALLQLQWILRWQTSPTITQSYTLLTHSSIVYIFSYLNMDL